MSSVRRAVDHRGLQMNSSFPEFGVEVSDIVKGGIGNENSISPLKKNSKVKNSTSILSSAAPKSRSSSAKTPSPVLSASAHQANDLMKHYYSDDDEFDQFTSQRIDVKESSELLILNSPDRTQLLSPTRKNTTGNNDNTNNTTKKTHYITIIDYEFDFQMLTINYGDSLEFRLSVDVPLHAEHQLQGTSADSNLLIFESPLLQQEECTSFVYTPKDVGTMVVQCTIYPDMICNITIKDSLTAETPLASTPQKPGKSKSSKSDADSDIVPYNVSITQTNFDCYKRLIEHVAGDIVCETSALINSTALDSHAGVGEKDYHGSMGYTSSHGGTSVCDSDDSASVTGDTATNTPVRDRKTVKNRSNEIIHENKVPSRRSVGDVVPVIVRDFEFHPKELEVTCGTRIKFIFECNSSQKLYCEGQFEGISLDNHPSKKCADSSYSHDFWDVGTYTVSNEVFSFMLCTIRVKESPLPAPAPKVVMRREIKKLDDITEMNAVVTSAAASKEVRPIAQEPSVAVESESAVLSEADLRRKQRNKKKREKKKLNKELKLLAATDGGDDVDGCDAAEEEQAPVQDTVQEEQASTHDDANVCYAQADKNEDVAAATSSAVTPDASASVLVAPVEPAVTELVMEQRDEMIADATDSVNVSLNEEQVVSSKKVNKNKKKKNKKQTIPPPGDGAPAVIEVPQDNPTIADSGATQDAPVSEEITTKVTQYFKDIEEFMCGRMSIVREAYQSQGYDLTASAKRVPIVVYSEYLARITPALPQEPAETVEKHRRRRPHRHHKAAKKETKT